MSRTQLTLGGILVVQVLLLFALRGPFSGQAAETTARPFLPALESITPVRLQIDGGEEDSSVVLESQDGQWTLAAAGGYPVDGTKVDQLLSDLEELKIRRPVVTSDRYHDALKVSEDNHERRLRVWEEPDADPQIDLLLGTSPNYRISHAREAGDQNVYEVMGLSTFDLRSEASAWIDKKFVDIPSDQVTALRVQNTHGSFELEKQDAGWTVTAPAAAIGKTLDQGKVDSLVKSFVSLWLEEPAGRVDEAAHGLASPAATIEIVTGGDVVATPPSAPEAGADGESPPPEPEATTPVEITTLRIGGMISDDEESGKRYAARSGFDYTVVLGKFDAEKATDKKLEDLELEAEAEPAAE